MGRLPKWQTTREGGTQSQRSPVDGSATEGDMKMKFQTKISTLFAGLCFFGALGAAQAEDRVQVGFTAEPGDAAFGYVPASVSPDEVVVVLIDKSGPMVSGVVLLTHGRSVAFSGIESHPFAVTEAYEPAMIAFADK